MPLPRDGDPVSALAKRLSELKRRTTTTTTTTTTSPPKNAKNASKKSENNIGETFDVEDRRGRDQFASALKSAREKWKDRDGENVRTRTATMSPVHKSTREGREGRERERGKEQRSPNLGKPMRIPVEVGKKNGAEKDSRRRRNEFQPIPIKPSIEEANMNGSTSSSNIKNKKREFIARVENERMKMVLKHPTFKENPVKAVLTHLAAQLETADESADEEDDEGNGKNAGKNENNTLAHAKKKRKMTPAQLRQTQGEHHAGPSERSKKSIHRSSALGGQKAKKKPKRT